MKQIPNLFTLLNLFFGCCASAYILTNGLTVFGDMQGGSFIAFPPEIWYASLFIGLAAVVDFLDGFVARLMGAVSEMGKQLDSLADVVSFGVAPSLILFQFLRLSFAKEVDGLDISWWWLSPAFIVACAAAYRLARFNLDTTQQTGFKGVPVPAIGLLVASFPLIYWFGNNTQINELLRNKWVLYVIIALLSYLMVSKLPMMALKFKTFKPSENLPVIVLAVLTILAGVLLQWLAVPVVFILYIIVSLAFKKSTK